ncbi:isochorismatase family protein [Enterococcus faecalis 13-SD-W-01]|nr:isochorismatase family protein [Enterococcus faecalis 13-SD-W-01]
MGLHLYSGGDIVLVVVDMQNHILDPESNQFVSGAEELVPKIAQRVAKAHEKNEFVLFTQDIPVDYKDTEEENEFEFQLIDALGMDTSDTRIKKYYFTIPPEKLIRIKEEFFADKKEEKKIQLAGVETNLCVLSNALGLQSVFPEADIYIDPTLVAANTKQQESLELLKHFNIEIKEDAANAMEHE